MKALIRNPGETVLEYYNIPCIDWNTGAPLTNPDWSGGPYTMVNDYVAKDPDADFASADTTHAAAPDADTIVIEGKKYSKEELRSLLK